MSLWSGFKKKLNEGWSGLDVWDKEENQAQRQAFANPQVAPQQQVVTRTRPAPRSGMMGLPSAEPNNTVEDLFTNKQAPVIEAPKPEAPKQSMWEKLKDQVDPNSEADKFRRKQAGDVEQYQAKGVGKVVKSFAKPFTETADTVVQGARYGAGVVTGNDAARDSAFNQARESFRESLPGVIYKPAEDMTVNALYHYPRAVIAGGNPLDAGYQDRYDKYLRDNNLTGNIIRDTVAPAAETALNVISLGEASALGAGFKEGIQNSGLKTAVREAVPGLVTTAKYNALQGGATELYNEDPTIKGAVQKGATGAVTGTVGDIAMVGLPSYIGAKGGKNRIPRLLETGTTEILPNGKGVILGMSDELKASPGVVPEVNRIKATDINLGDDFDVKNVNPELVAKYVDDIRSGKPIDPLVVRKDGGRTILDEGNERMVALRQLGVDEMPTVTRDLDKVAQSTPAGVTPQLNNLGTMPDYRNRTGPVLTRTQELSKKYGVTEATIDRMTKQYGDAKASTMLARTSDASNIKDMDAFYVSEMRKNFGSPNVRIKRNTMSPEEIASLEKTAPVNVPTKTASTTPAIEPAKGNTVDISEPSKLGSITKEFYDSKKGNKKIKFTDLDNLGQKIASQIDDDFKAIGSDFRDVARKVETAARDGVRELDQVNLSPAENALWKKVQDEMDYVRRRQSTGKRKIGEGDYKDVYLPNQKVGQYTTDSLFKGFRDTMPGNEKTRMNKIALDELDYSPEVVGQYITRYGDTKLYSQERLARALEKDNQGTDINKINLAAQKVINLQEKVNKIETKVGAFGFGTKKQLADGEFVDIAKELSDVGRDLDHKLTVISDAPKGLTNGEKINSISVDGVPLGDRLGLNQYRDAQTYAAKQFADSQGNKQALTDMVRQKLNRDHILRPDEVENAISAIERIPDNVPDEVVQARVQGIYESTAKQQLMRELQNVDITNPKLRKEVSMISNQILREGSIEASVAQKVVKGVLKTQNAIFRKLNLGTAINELGDLPGFFEVYGSDLKLVPDFSKIKQFGLGDIDPAIQPYIDQAAKGVPNSTILRSINDKTNLYKYVEHYKAAVVADSASSMYAKQGLKGDLLTKKVLQDYRELTLPVDAFTKTFLDNAPLYTQYMSWGARNLQKEGRLLTGKLESGKLADKTQWERIARNAYTNLPAKTVFWLSSNALKGTALMTAFGITDFTGLTNQDYSGIAEEDKSIFDKTTKVTNASTTMSLLNSIVQSYEKEQLKNSDKYKDANYNPYSENHLVGDIVDKYTPSTIKNVVGTNRLTSKGFADNQDSFSDTIREQYMGKEDKGKVQYEAPDDIWNITKSYLFGKSQTDKAREYSGTQDVFRRGIKEIPDMAKESVGLKETNYSRSLNQEYTDKYRQADEGARKALLQGGRQYNAYLDNLKKTDKASYDNYISAMDGNHVSPEYWKSIAGTDPAKADLTTFKMIGDRKKQAAKDLGKQYDPTYDLPDDQARAIIQQKSTATGDDIPLRNALYKEQWYKDYMAKMSKYYDSKQPTDSDFEQTKRVKDWYSLSDQYNKLSDPVEENEWTKKYPVVAQQKAISEKYGFDSDQSKSFFKANGDAYKEQKALYDGEKLSLINKMREIEGYPPMSEDAYAQATKIADTDGEYKKKGGYSKGGRGGSGGIYAKAGDYGKAGALNLPSVKIKVNKVKVAPKNKSKYVKIQKNKS